MLILGTGERMMFVLRARETLRKIGIQVELQDTVLPLVTMV